MAGTVSDIASLWPLALIVLALIFIIAFRRELRVRLLKGGVRVKKGDASIEIDATDGDSDGPGFRSESEELAAPEDVLAEGPGSSWSTATDAVSDGDAEPLATWDRVFAAALAGDPDGARRGYEQIRAGAKDEIAKRRSDVIWAYIRASELGNSEAREELHQLAADPEPAISARARINLGMLHYADGYYEQALQEFDQASANADSETTKTTAIVRATDALERLERSDEAIRRLGEAVTGIESSEERQRCYLRLAEILGGREEYLLQAIALESALEATPDNASLRFDTGYAYSRGGHEKLALLHYLAAIRVDPAYQSARNNAGVAYETLQMPATSTAQYERAAELGLSLANANLALRLMNAGFTREAEELLREEAKRPDAHPNIGAHLADLAKRREHEADLQAKTIRDAEKEQMFWRKYSSARFAVAEMPDVTGEWALNGQSTQVTRSGSNFVGQLMVGQDAAEFRASVVNQSLEYELWVEKFNFAKSPPTKELGKRTTGHGYLHDSNNIRLRAADGTEGELTRRPG